MESGWRQGCLEGKYNQSKWENILVDDFVSVKGGRKYNGKALDEEPYIFGQKKQKNLSSYILHAHYRLKSA